MTETTATLIFSYIAKNICIAVNYTFLFQAEAASSLKKQMFLEILQNSQQNPCCRVSFLIIVQVWGL